MKMIAISPVLNCPSFFSKYLKAKAFVLLILCIEPETIETLVTSGLIYVKKKEYNLQYAILPVD